MRTALIVLLLLSTFVADGWSQEERRPFGSLEREPQKVLVPPRPPVETTLITMTGQHQSPQQVEPISRGLALLVPVTLERLDPHLTHARIKCHTAYTGTIYQNQPLTFVAEGYSNEMEILNGALSDSLLVPLQPLPGKDVNNSRGYYCLLQLMVGGTWMPAYGITETYAVDPDQPLKFATNGEFPR